MGMFQNDGAMIFIIFIGAIIATALIAPIADELFVQRNTFTLANETFTAATNGSNVAITGRELVGSGEVYNGTTIVPAINVSISQAIGSDGLLSVVMFTNNSEFSSLELNASYTYRPDGYINGGGARSIAGLIVIFAALAIMIFVIVQIFKNEDFRKILGR